MKCPQCQMSYLPESIRDRRLHKTYHDIIENGYHYKQYKSERKIFESDGFSITLIDNNSNKYEISRAIDIGRIGYEESGYDSSPFDISYLTNKAIQGKVFILYSNNRAIGILVMGRFKLKWNLTWDDYESNIQHFETHDKRILWSGDFVWIHNKYRQRGLAKLLINQALKYMHISINDFAYSSQFSNFGKILAKSISPRFLGSR